MHNKNYFLYALFSIKLICKKTIKQLYDMNRKEIGINACTIWNLLYSNNGILNYKEIKKATGLSDRNINAAIGWLACEDKVYFVRDRECDCLSLILNIYI